jgi:putative hydrolase of the HAD superfamily
MICDLAFINSSFQGGTMINILLPDPTPQSRPAIDPDAVSCWIFDLDNTLYPAASNLFARVSRRMTAFIQAEFALAEEGARALQKKLFLEYGTTMRGLMVEHGTDPERFLHYVHDIDVSDMAPDPRLAALIDLLPGRRVIFTNGSVPHADRITRQLGIDGLFEGTFDIVAGNFIPKPDPQPYRDMIARFGLDPTSSVMIEDMAKNLKPAAEMGMTTVWLRHDMEWSSDGADDGHVHHEITDLTAWLEQITGAGVAC